MASDSPDLLHVLRKRVEVLRAEGRLEDALRVAQTAADTARRHVAGSSGPVSDLVSLLITLADLRRSREDPDGAEQAYLEGLNLATGAAAEDASLVPDLDVARLQAGLASLYDFGGREAEALPRYLDAIRRLEALGPDERLEAAALRNNVAMILKGSGDFAGAESHYLAALDTFTAALGPNHPTVATVLNNLGSLYTFAGRSAEAEDAHRRALAIRSRNAGKNSPDHAQSLANLAALFHREGDRDQALLHYRQACRLLEAHLPASATDYAIVLRNLADLHRESGDEAAARAVEDELQARLGPT
jgi:Tfp pilus assembly protein PilF